MPKHTPGPWTIGHSYTEEQAIREPDGECVAVVCYMPGEETQANAHLIAAAPDLLAALELCGNELKSTFAGEQCDHAVGACYCPVFRALDMADAAIAKARGE